jgi:transcriptional regulator with XRE-family HTH domain
MASQQKFGQNLKLARKKANLTQQQIADKANMHVNYYARIERGGENPSYEALEKIIKALCIKSSEVLPF